MLISLIICTRNRAAQLRNCLASIATATKPDCAVELILVDNGSTDSTRSVIADFIPEAPCPARYVHCATPGLSAARNAGIAAASGIWLAFTDDDCYLDRDYFLAFHAFVKSLPLRSIDGAPIAYGGGQIHFFDRADDGRMAHRYFEDYWEIPKHTLLAGSAVQGANMFFHRKVPETIGGFDETLGGGGVFGCCEDIEFACRASRAGFTGLQVPSLKIQHHPARQQDSAEAQATYEAYDRGRGAYYANLLDQGLVGAWQLWANACALDSSPAPELRERLLREFEGAAEYLRQRLTEREVG